MAAIQRTEVQYVRCIKPNANKSKDELDCAMVVEQLRCAGVVEVGGWVGEVFQLGFSRFARCLVQGMHLFVTPSSLLIGGFLLLPSCI